MSNGDAMSQQQSQQPLPEGRGLWNQNQFGEAS
jgi:hypothetical protein